MIFLLTSFTMMAAMLISAAVMIVNEALAKSRKVERSGFNFKPHKNRLFPHD